MDRQAIDNRLAQMDERFEQTTRKLGELAMLEAAALARRDMAAAELHAAHWHILLTDIWNIDAELASLSRAA